MERKKVCWHLNVSKVLDDAVEKAVEMDTHATKADFIRDAVRGKLASMGFKNEPFKEIQAAPGPSS